MDEHLMPGRTCPGCGASAPSAAEFCGSCGQRLPPSAGTGQPASAGPARLSGPTRAGVPTATVPAADSARWATGPTSGGPVGVAAVLAVLAAVAALVVPAIPLVQYGVAIDLRVAAFGVLVIAIATAGAVLASGRFRSAGIGMLCATTATILGDRIVQFFGSSSRYWFFGYDWRIWAPLVGTGMFALLVLGLLLSTRSGGSVPVPGLTTAGFIMFVLAALGITVPAVSIAAHAELKKLVAALTVNAVLFILAGVATWRRARPWGLAGLGGAYLVLVVFHAALWHAAYRPANLAQLAVGIAVLVVAVGLAVAGGSIAQKGSSSGPGPA